MRNLLVFLFLAITSFAFCAGELHHADVGAEMTRAEYTAISGHVLDGGQTGDLIYQSGGNLVRLPIGSTNQLIRVVGGVPAWWTADYVTSGTSVAHALEADVCTTATFAVLAATAQVANTATTSTYAVGAGTAYLAYNADNATTATHATTSTYAASAGAAATATHATSADTATTSTYATTSGMASFATNANYASASTTADSSSYADVAGTASSADTAETAGSASIAAHADTCTTATYALNAGGVSALSELTDVELTSLTTPQNLRWSYGKWRNSNQTPLDVAAGTYTGILGAWDFLTTPTVNGVSLGTGLTGETGATGPQGPEGAAGVPLPSYMGNAGKYLKVDTGETTATWSTIDSLPSQTGNSGKYLTTDGSAASWGAVSGGSTTVYYTSGTLANGASFPVTHASDQYPGYKRVPHVMSRTFTTSGTTLLLHADGTTSSTSFTDSSALANAITGGSGVMNTPTQSKFGGSSAYFSGSNSYLNATTGDAFRFPGDFTISFWMYLPSVSASQTIYDGRGSGNGLTIYETGGSMRLYSGGDVISGGTIAANTWYHIAVVRSGSVVKMYVNGTQVGSTWTSSTNFNAGGVSIGRNYGSNDYVLTGYIDEFRISNGIARWTSNFTPDTSAYTADTPNYYASCTQIAIGGSYNYFTVVYPNDTTTVFTNNTGASGDFIGSVQLLP